MAKAAGSEFLVGLRQESTFGTAVDCNATGHGFRPIEGSFSHSGDREHVPDKSLNGSPVDRDSGLMGPWKGSISYMVDMKYQGLSRQTGLFLGTSGNPAAVTSFFGHTQTIRNIMEGRSATIAFYDGVNYHQYVGCRCTELELEGEFGSDCLTAKFTWQPRFRQVNTSPNTSLSSMTEPTPIDRVQPVGTTVSYQICAVGGTLAAIEIKKWKISMKRPYPYSFSSTGQHLCRESRPGKWTGTVSIEFPALETAFETYRDLTLTAGNLYALSLDHTLTAGEKRLKIGIPSFKATKVMWTPKDKGEVPQSMEGVAELATTSTTGLTESTTPFLYYINSDSAAQVA